MASASYVSPVVGTTTIFKDDLFSGKVLFCTGGGSGICKAMTEAVVCVHSFNVSKFIASLLSLS